MRTGSRTLWIGPIPAVTVEGLPPDVAESLRRRLGARPGESTRDAGVVVMSAGSDEPKLLHRIGTGDAGITAAGDLVLFEGSGEVRIQSRAASGRLAISCKGPVRDVSLVAGLVQLNLLERGYVPVHAAVVRTADGLLAVGGWSGAGKTAALLAMIDDAGAEPVAAEWIYLPEHGPPVPAEHAVRLRAHHLGTKLAQASSGRMPRTAIVAAAGAIRQADRTMKVLGRPAAPVRRALARAGRRLYLDVPVPPAPRRSQLEALTSLVLLLATDGPAASALVDREAIATRIAAAFEHDLAAVTAAAQRYRFAFGRPAPWGDDWPVRYRAALALRLEGVSTREVWHPRSGDPAALARRIAGVPA